MLWSHKASAQFTCSVEKLKSRLDSLDIDKCKNIILHVGGNDAANGEDLDDFRDNYEFLIDSVYVDDRCVIISELFPRDDADMKPYNEVLRWNLSTISIASFLSRAKCRNHILIMIKFILSPGGQQEAAD